MITNAMRWGALKARLLKQMDDLNESTPWQETEPGWWLEMVKVRDLLMAFKAVNPEPPMEQPKPTEIEAPKVETREQRYERYQALGPLYLQDDPSVDISEFEKLAVEFGELDQAQEARAAERIAKMYPRNSVAAPDPSIFQDMR